MVSEAKPYSSGMNAMQLIGIFLLMQLAVAFLTNGFGFSFDEAMWQYIGRNWVRNGMIPYRGGVDNKSPLIFAIFGLSDKIFGTNFWFPRVLATVIQSIGLYFLYKIAIRIANSRVAILAVTLYGLSLLWRSTGGKYVAYTETYSVTFVIIAFYYFFTAENARGFFASGLLAGFSVAFRLTACFAFAGILISAALANRKNALIFLSGGIVALAIFALSMQIFGISMHDFIVYAVTDNFGQGSSTDHALLWKLENFTDKFFYSELILFYPALVGYFLTRKKLDPLGIWLIAAFLGISAIGIFDRVHLKELLPPLCLINAVFIGEAVELWQLSSKKLTIMVWIVFFPKLLEPFISLKKLFLPGARDQSESFCRQPSKYFDVDSKRELGKWIRSNTEPGQKVLISGSSAELQAYSERESPTIYFNATQTQLAKKRFREDLRTNKPYMVLIPRFASYEQNMNRELRGTVDSLVNQSYDYDTCQYGYGIYKIRKTIK